MAISPKLEENAVSDIRKRKTDFMFLKLLNKTLMQNKIIEEFIKELEEKIKED